MRLYSISDDYIEYLRKVFPRVYSNKIANRIVKTAKLLYSKKTKSTNKNPVIDKVLDFKALEEYSTKW